MENTVDIGDTVITIVSTMLFTDSAVSDNSYTFQFDTVEIFNNLSVFLGILDDNVMEFIFNLFPKDENVTDINSLAACIEKYQVKGSVNVTLEKNAPAIALNCDVKNVGKFTLSGKAKLDNQPFEGSEYDALSENFPQNYQDYETVNLLSINTYGTISLFDSATDTTNAHYNWKLKADIDPFEYINAASATQGKENGYEWFNMAKNSMFHFQIYHLPGANCSAFCASKLDPNARNVIDIFMDPQSMGDNLIRVNINLKAILGEEMLQSIFDILGVNMSDIDSVIQGLFQGQGTLVEFLKGKLPSNLMFTLDIEAIARYLDSTDFSKIPLAPKPEPEPPVEETALEITDILSILGQVTGFINEAVHADANGISIRFTPLVTMLAPMLGDLGIGEEMLTGILDAVLGAEGAKSDSVRFQVDGLTFADPTLKTYNVVEDAITYQPGSTEKRNWEYSDLLNSSAFYDAVKSIKPYYSSTADTEGLAGYTLISDPGSMRSLYRKGDPLSAQELAAFKGKVVYQEYTDFSGNSNAFGGLIVGIQGVDFNNFEEQDIYLITAMDDGCLISSIYSIAAPLLAGMGIDLPLPFNLVKTTIKLTQLESVEYSINNVAYDPQGEFKMQVGDTLSSNNYSITANLIYTDGRTKTVNNLPFNVAGAIESTFDLAVGGMSYTVTQGASVAVSFGYVNFPVEVEYEVGGNDEGESSLEERIEMIEVLDEEGNPVVDEAGNPVLTPNITYEQDGKTVQVKKRTEAFVNGKPTFLADATVTVKLMNPSETVKIPLTSEHFTFQKGAIEQGFFVNNGTFSYTLTLYGKTFTGSVNIADNNIATEGYYVKWGDIINDEEAKNQWEKYNGLRVSLGADSIGNLEESKNFTLDYAIRTTATYTYVDITSLFELKSIQLNSLDPIYDRTNQISFPSKIDWLTLTDGNYYVRVQLLDEEGNVVSKDEMLIPLKKVVMETTSFSTNVSSYGNLIMNFAYQATPKGSIYNENKRTKIDYTLRVYDEHGNIVREGFTASNSVDSRNLGYVEVSQVSATNMWPNIRFTGMKAGTYTGVLTVKPEGQASESISNEVTIGDYWSVSQTETDTMTLTTRAPTGAGNFGITFEDFELYTNYNPVSGTGTLVSQAYSLKYRLSTAATFEELTQGLLLKPSNTSMYAIKVASDALAAGTKATLILKANGKELVIGVTIMPTNVTITLPTSEAFTVAPVAGFNTTMESGLSFKFTVTMNAGYMASALVVKAGQNELTPVSGVYTINSVGQNMAVTVSGVSKIAQLRTKEGSTHKTRFGIGQRFAYTGLVLEFVLENGDVVAAPSVSTTNYTIVSSAVNINALGTYEISVTDKNYSMVCTYNVEYVAPDLMEFNTVGAKNKIWYGTPQDLWNPGTTLRMYLTFDGVRYSVTNNNNVFTLDFGELNTVMPGDYAVTVKLTAAPELTAQYTLTVLGPDQNLSIKQQKDTFAYGEAFSKGDDFKITATYLYAFTLDAQHYTVTCPDYDAERPGEYTAKVSFANSDHVMEYTVTVGYTTDMIEKIEVFTDAEHPEGYQPTKFALGEPFYTTFSDNTGLIILATQESTGKSFRLNANDVTVDSSGYVKNTAGTYTITVSAGASASATYTVQVGSEYIKQIKSYVTIGSNRAMTGYQIGSMITFEGLSSTGNPQELTNLVGATGREYKIEDLETYKNAIEFDLGGYVPMENNDVSKIYLRAKGNSEVSLKLAFSTSGSYSSLASTTQVSTTKTEYTVGVDTQLDEDSIIVKGQGAYVLVKGAYTVTHEIDFNTAGTYTVTVTLTQNVRVIKTFTVKVVEASA